MSMRCVCMVLGQFLLQHSPFFNRTIVFTRVHGTARIMRLFSMFFFITDVAHDKSNDKNEQRTAVGAAYTCFIFNAIIAVVLACINYYYVTPLRNELRRQWWGVVISITVQ